MTPEELERAYKALENASAAADAGDEQAAADATELANMIKSAQATQAPAPETPAPEQTGFGDTGTGQVVSGVNEGFFGSVLGAPTSILRGMEAVGNLPNRGVNAVANMMGYEGELAPISQSSITAPGAPGSPEWQAERMRADDSAYAKVVGAPASTAPNGNNPILRRAAELTGQGAAALLPFAGRGSPKGTPGYQGGMADTIATAASRPAAAATIPAVEAGVGLTSSMGGEIAAGVGGEEWRSTGETIGALGPAAVGAGAQRATAGVLGGETSAATYEAARRAGVDPSAGLVGNRAARLAEQAAALNPLANKVVTGKQIRQAEGLGEAFDRTTGKMRPEGVEAAPDPYAAGSRIADEIETVDPATGQRTGLLPDLEAEMGRLGRQEMTTLGGKKQALDVTRINAAIDRRMKSATAEVRDSLQQVKNSLERDRTTPIDKKLHDQITARIKTRRQRLAALEGKNSPLTRKELREQRNLRYRLKRDEAQMDANMGVSNERLDQWRKKIGQGTTTRDRVDAEESKSIYAAVRGTQGAEANRRGTRQEFNETVAEKRRIAGSPGLDKGGEMDFLRKLATKEPEQVFKAITAPDAAGRIAAMKRLMPAEQFNTMASDILTTMARPTSQAQIASDMSTDAFAPTAFGTKWAKLPAESSFVRVVSA